MDDIVRWVDPNELRLPPSRIEGADVFKLFRQIGLYGRSTDTMPPLFVFEDPDGLLEIMDGVTRATRIARLVLDGKVPVIVTGRYRKSRASSPSVKDRL